MKATAEDISKLAQSLKQFLVEEGWIEGSQARGLTFFLPPQSLGIEGRYSIAIPNDPFRKGVANLIYGAANSLVDLYGYGNVGSLLNRAAPLIDSSAATRLVARFGGEKTQNGAIPLTSLSSYASNVEQSLYRGAKFKLGAETKENKLVAQRFVGECKFLQTEFGSFVTKIEIPFSVLRQADLFGGEIIVSTEVCSSLFSALQFINDRILGDDDDFESPAIIENVISLFDVEFLDSLAKIIIEPEMDLIEFSIEIGTQVRSSSTGWLGDDQKNRLREFISFVREQLRDEDDISVLGTIVELRSRDPEGNKNYIRVVTSFHGDRTFISATLNNEQYQRALEAHAHKRQVRISGNGTRLKTQVRLNDVTDFSVR